MDDAREADVIGACICEWAYVETPGNTGDLTSPDVQLDLLHGLEVAGKPTISVLTEKAVPASSVEWQAMRVG